MTIFQYVVLFLACPIGLICFLKMFFTIIYKHNNDFGLLEAILLVASALAIAFAFLGVK